MQSLEPISYLVQIAGQPLADDCVVESLQTTAALGAISTATLNIRGIDEQTDATQLLDLPRFQPGQPVQIWAGDALIFTGTLRRLTVRVAADLGTLNIVECQGQPPEAPEELLRSHWLDLTLGDNVLEAELWHEAEKPEICGKFRIQGQPAEPGSAVRIHGASDRIRQRLFEITGVEQSIANSEWFTQLHCRATEYEISAEQDEAASPAAGTQKTTVPISKSSQTIIHSHESRSRELDQEASKLATHLYQDTE